MTNIEFLPLLKVVAGVQGDEDFNPSIAFMQSDGVTPIGLAGIAFTAKIGSLATLSTSAGSLVVSGPGNNVLSFSAPAIGRAIWPTGPQPLSLQATDGTYTRDVFANSTLIVGNPASFSVTTFSTPGASAAVIGTFTAVAIAAALAGLSPAQLSMLRPRFFPSGWTRCRSIPAPGRRRCRPASGFSTTAF